ncbi:MAG: hypothetical protein ACPGSI_15290 [Pikeienuella sp.]
MSEDWAAAQTEIAAGIAEVGAPCVLRRPQADGPSDPWSSGGTGPTYHAFTAVQDTRRVRDASGTFIGRTETVLMLAAGGIVPLKSDYVLFNAQLADVDDDTPMMQIGRVDTEHPGDTPLYYEIVLKD